VHHHFPRKLPVAGRPGVDSEPGETRGHERFRHGGHQVGAPGLPKKKLVTKKTKTGWSNSRENVPCTRVARFFLVQHTKTGENPTYYKIYQMAVKYTDIFHCKILQQLSKFGFLV
jgi:hypothetical protein